MKGFWDRNGLDPFEGFLDDVAIWDGIIDQNSVTSLFNGADPTTITVVPEPSSFALLAGMFGLTWVMLRRRS